MQRLAQGESAETVMEDMARRIMEKMLHPVFKSLQESAITKFDPIKNRQDYESTMRYHKPVADHVDGNLFDKDR